MIQPITTAKALKELQITKHELNKLEKEFTGALYVPWPVPRDPDTGYRLYDAQWIGWIRNVLDARAAGMRWQHIWQEMPDPNRQATRQLEQELVSVGPEY